jgi:hypothetical protein
MKSKQVQGLLVGGGTKRSLDQWCWGFAAFNPLSLSPLTKMTLGWWVLLTINTYAGLNHVMESKEFERATPIAFHYVTLQIKIEWKKVKTCLVRLNIHQCLVCDPCRWTLEKEHLRKNSQNILGLAQQNGFGPRFSHSLVCRVNK